VLFAWHPVGQLNTAVLLFVWQGAPDAEPSHAVILAEVSVTITPQAPPASTLAFSVMLQSTDIVEPPLPLQDWTVAGLVLLSSAEAIQLPPRIPLSASTATNTVATAT
jgi:hypothetical protein